VSRIGAEARIFLHMRLLGSLTMSVDVLAIAGAFVAWEGGA
jgi:hypothetical protein